MVLRIFFNKALFYKEIKSLWSLIIVMWLLLFKEFSLSFITFTNNLTVFLQNEHKIQPITDYLNISMDTLINNGSIFFTLLIIISISFWIIGQDRQNKNNEFLATMPFSREEIIGTKWFTVTISIIIPMIINFIIIMLVYSSNKTIYSNFLEMHKFLLYWIFTKTLMLIFISTFVMFVQSISGRVFVGGLLSSIFLLVPLFLSASIPTFLKYFSVINNKTIIPTTTLAILESHSYKIGNFLIFTTNSENILDAFENKILLISIGIIILLLFLLLAFSNNKLEKTDQVCMFLAFEYILKIGVSICFALLITPIAVETNSHTIEDVYIAGPTALITLVVAYFITHKIIKYFK